MHDELHIHSSIEDMWISIVIAPIVLFSDDTSGNKSKKWNKFDSLCMTLAGLPLHMADKAQHMHFISCSNKLSALDMVASLMDDLLKVGDGVCMYDTCTLKGEELLVITPVMFILCDNP